MKYVIVVISSIRENVLFSPATEKFLTSLIKDSKSSYVKEWIRTYLVTFFLGPTFHNRYSFANSAILKKKYNYIVEIPDKNIYWEITDEETLNSLPTRYKREGFYLDLSKDWIGKCASLIDYMNSIDWKNKIKWSVPDAFKRMELFLAQNSVTAKTIHVLDCGDYIWYRLDNSAAMRYEGIRMQNCVGLDIHSGEISRGEAIFLSLRNRQDTPFVSLKYNPKTNIILDIRGKQNKPPITRYWKYICELVNRFHLKPVGKGLPPFNKFKYDSILDKWEINSSYRKLGVLVK